MAHEICKVALFLCTFPTRDISLEIKSTGSVQETLVQIMILHQTLSLNIFLLVYCTKNWPSLVPVFVFCMLILFGNCNLNPPLPFQIKKNLYSFTRHTNSVLSDMNTGDRNQYNRT